jgi:hypothetical protein
MVAAFVLFFVFAVGFSEPPSWKGLPYPVDETYFATETFYYRMRGSVRILFFWIGKDNVGGGSISRITAPSLFYGEKIDGYSVLFGSDPDAVPGKHNRWGYARELAYWDQSGESPELIKSTFEGFMSKSSEESMDAVREKEQQEGTESLTLFEGAISEVRPKTSLFHMWRFNATSQATYRDPEIVGTKYLEVKNAAPPDVERSFENSRAQYNQPIGFITAIRLLMEPILLESQSSSRLSHFKDTALQYVNSAHLYTLRVTKAKRHKKFELNDRVFQNVLQLDFQTLRHDQNKKHSFTLWIPTSGPFQGIPLRITDKPRWWLKVELNLDLERTESTRMDMVQEAKEGQLSSSGMED